MNQLPLYEVTTHSLNDEISKLTNAAQALASQKGLASGQYFSVLKHRVIRFDAASNTLAKPIELGCDLYENDLPSDEGDLSNHSHNVDINDLIWNMLALFPKVTAYIENTLNANRNHCVTVSPTVYPNRSSNPSKHRDGHGDMLFVILAYANNDTIRGPILFPGSGPFDRSSDERSKLPATALNDILEARDSLVDVKSDIDIMPNGAICFCDEALWHASPPSHSRYELSQDPTTFAQHVFPQPLPQDPAILKDLDTVRNHYKNDPNVQTTDPATVSEALKRLWRQQIYPYGNLGKTDMYLVVDRPYTEPGTGRLRVFNSGDVKSTKYMAGAAGRAVVRRRESFKAVNLSSTNTVSQQNRRSFIRLWIRLVPIKEIY